MPLRLFLPRFKAYPKGNSPRNRLLYLTRSNLASAPDLATLAEMIDFVPLLNGLYSQLKELGGLVANRKKEAFEKVLIPFNGDFIAVHGSYETMFANTQAKCRGVMYDGLVTRFEGDPPAQTLGEVIDEFELFRNGRNYEFSRDRCRKVAADLLSTTSDVIFRRYLCSVLYYFIDDSKTSERRPTWFYDDHVNAILLKNGGDAIRTPSFQLRDDLRSAETPEDAINVIDVALNVLWLRFSDTQRYFEDLRRSVYPV